MRTGFWLLNDENFDCLADTKIGNVSHLLHGFCPTFALALRDIFGYPLYGAYAYDAEIESDGLVHMFCETPNGLLIDVRGIIDDWDEFMDAFADEFSNLDDDVYVQPTDGAGFEGSSEYELAINLINAYPEYYALP